MRIRTLEITGFKSFGDRAVLAFPKGLSAVVGPNGCGKSNVVDAIRWVMGEQNPRQLRGRLMEDMIFSGTETKEPVGMAQVILTLDNSDGLAAAPYDGFSEIQITRRLYRSGESEYLINKVPVRLRDVTDFFLDTGVGTRGYTIVEQGRIGEIVSTKPEDRRVIIEEAAGIGKYRQRRRETERKLQATEQNLLRVTDILGELRRQIGSLDRQARRAARYKELSALVRDLELEVTQENFQVDAERRRELEEQLESARAEAIARDANVARVDSSLEEERRVHLDQERELQRSSERLFSMRSEIQSTESRVEWERRERDGLSRLIEDRQGEIAELEQQLGVNRASLQEAVQEYAAVDARIGIGESDRAQRDAELRRQGDQRAELQGKREALQSRLVQLSAEGGTLGSRAEGLDERRSEIELSLRKSEEALEASGLEVEEISRDQASLEGGLRTSLAEQGELSHRLSELMRESARAAEQREATESELASLKGRGQQLAARLETLREAERRESQRVADTLERLSPGERRGVRGLLSEVLRVRDDVEPALEAVLQGRLDAVLVENPEAGLALLRAFRKRAAGRAVALSLHAGDDRPLSGFVPLGRPLLELVEVDAGFRPLVERLLRDVYLVDDLAEAVKRFGVSDPPAVFVTREGELLDRSGALTGGSGAPAGALSRGREIRDLGAELQGVEERCRQVSGEVQSAEDRVSELGRDTENARNRRHTAELAVVNVEKDLERARERSKAALEAGEGLRTDKGRLLSELERSDAEREGTRRRVEAIERELATAEAGQDDLAAAVAASSRELERLDQSLVQSRVELAELRARGDQLQENRNRLRSQVNESVEWVSRRNEEVRSAKERTEELGQSTVEAEASLAQLIRQEEELRARQDAARGGYEQSSGSVKRLELEGRSASRERDEAREAVSSSELAVQEVRMRLDQLRERILERYGVDLSTYRSGERGRGERPDRESRETELRRLRASLQSLGEVHLGAIEEYEEVSERHRYLDEQKADLELSIERLRGAISRINRTSRARFRETFEAVNAEFQKVFPRMFRGGRASLSLTESEDVLEAGIEISAQPPGKRLQSVNLLSGGEKALTAISLLIAVFRVKPSPFFLLDEVDAALDDANVGRFDDLLAEMSANSQFVVITHNKSSIESADVLYGVTMEEPGLSKLVTVDLVT